MNTTARYIEQDIVGPFAEVCHWDEVVNICSQTNVD